MEKKAQNEKEILLRKSRLSVRKMKFFEVNMF